MNPLCYPPANLIWGKLSFTRPLTFQLFTSLVTSFLPWGWKFRVTLTTPVKDNILLIRLAGGVSPFGASHLGSLHASKNQRNLDYSSIQNCPATKCSYWRSQISDNWTSRLFDECLNREVSPRSFDSTPAVNLRKWVILEWLRPATWINCVSSPPLATQLRFFIIKSEYSIPFSASSSSLIALALSAASRCLHVSGSSLNFSLTVIVSLRQAP